MDPSGEVTTSTVVVSSLTGIAEALRKGDSRAVIADSIDRLVEYVVEAAVT